MKQLRNQSRMRQCVYSNFHTCDTAVCAPHAIYVDREGLVRTVGHHFDAVKRQAGSFRTRGDSPGFHIDRDCAVTLQWLSWRRQ